VPDIFGLIIIIIAVPVVPMTVVAPVPVAVRIIVAIVATIVDGGSVAIGRSHRYAKVAASLRFLGHEGDEPKRQQNWEKIAFHEINVLAL